MSDNKAINKANLELALTENNKRLLAHTEAANATLRQDLNAISQYQKYLNTELDYGVFETKNSSTSLITCTTVQSGNLSIDNEGYIILNANKNYFIYADLRDISIGNGICLVDKDGNKISAERPAGTFVILTTQEIHIAIVLSNDTTVYSTDSNIYVQEVGRSITIDPVEYVNNNQGIEDTPVGHIISHIGIKAPKHYLLCDGTEYNILDYPYLANHILNEFGNYNYFGGDGIITFAVPDLKDKSNTAIIYCIKYEPTYFMKNTNYLQPALYSLEEKIIGSWINGKPLYQKLLYNLNYTVTANTWTNLFSVNNLNIDELVYSNGKRNKKEGWTPELYFGISNDILQATTTSGSHPIFAILLQYTKTIDAENSFTPDMLS